MNKMRLSAVSFIRKSWSKSFNVGIVYNRVGSKFICPTVSRQYTKLFYELLTRATEPGRSMGGCKFINILRINVPKSLGRKSYVFWQKNFQRRQNSTMWNLVYTIPIRILLKPWTPSFRKITITAEIVSQLKCLEERKKLRFTLQMKDLVLNSLIRIWDTFSEVMLETSLE